MILYHPKFIRHHVLSSIQPIFIHAKDHPSTSIVIRVTKSCSSKTVSEIYNSKNSQCLHYIIHSNNEAAWMRFVRIIMMNASWLKIVAVGEFHPSLRGLHPLQRAIERLPTPFLIIHGCYHFSDFCSDGHAPSSSHQNLQGACRRIYSCPLY